MPSDWIKTTFEDFCDICRGGSPRPIHDFISNAGIPWVKIADATSSNSRYIKQTRDFIKPEGKKKSREVHPGDLILSNSATPGLPMIMGINACIHDGWLLLRNIQGVDKLFCYYLLIHERPKIVRQGSGTIFTNLKTDILKKHEVKIPSLPEQRARAHILGSLDDKIELNRRMNETLEAMARAIFKSWFVDFDPVRAKVEGRDTGLPEDIAALFPDSFVDSELGEIPKGWKSKPFGEIVEMTIGGDWGKEREDSRHTIKSVIIRGTDFPRLKEGQYGKTPTRWVEEKKLKKRQLEDGDILIEISGGSPKQPTGRSLFITNNLLARLGNIVEPASFCRLIRPKSRKLGLIAYQHLELIYSQGKMWEYQNQSTGISNFQTRIFLTEELVSIPDNDLIFSTYYKYCRLFYDSIQSNESLELGILRDTLLPKLISGDVRIANAADFLKERGL
jgi:type I restriction enzyme S subunit